MMSKRENGMGNVKSTRVLLVTIGLAASAALACNLMAQLTATPPPATAELALPTAAPPATAAPEATLEPTPIPHLMRPDSPGGSEGLHRRHQLAEDRRSGSRPRRRELSDQSL